MYKIDKLEIDKRDSIKRDFEEKLSGNEYSIGSVAELEKQIYKRK